MQKNMHTSDVDGGDIRRRGQQTYHFLPLLFFPHPPSHVPVQGTLTYSKPPLARVYPGSIFI